MADELGKGLESLCLAVEKKSDNIHVVLESLISTIQKSGDALGGPTLNTLLDQLGIILASSRKGLQSIEAAKAIAEVAKCDAGRDACLKHPTLINALLALLCLPETPVLEQEAASTRSTLTQACRALGNICYENQDGRKLILESDGLAILVNVLKWSITPPKGKSSSGEASLSSEAQWVAASRQLRNVSAGFLMNLLINQEEKQKKTLEMGILDILCAFLELDAGDEEVTNHVLLIVGLLTDCDSEKELMSERLCRAVVHVLGVSESPEVCEMCLDLLHGQAENETVKVHLAHAGLCETLIGLLKKHQPLLSEDDESRNLMKVACDLIVLILTGDESMNHLYEEGNGEVFQKMVRWLEYDDEDLQVTGVLAMGNFARTDKHCIQMVQKGVGKKLLNLVQKNNTSTGDIRLQHALLSALRNLAIPPQNKGGLLEDGLVECVLPMASIPTFPVVFKLLGTLRMVIDGQEKAAATLGNDKALVARLVEWCATDDHPGVQGEANRLIAWLIKNSKTESVMNTILDAGGLPFLVNMVTAEHAVMQNEALLALTLLTATLVSKQSVADGLLKADIGNRIESLLTNGRKKKDDAKDTSIPEEVKRDEMKVLQTEVILNALTLIGELIKSDELKEHIKKSGIKQVLNSLTEERLKKQAQQLTKLLDSG
ncbi:rap1 GTPase-GDP dissociation stimulator 1-B [Ischnura elegans]|uniref:rap1 GTPase-GDP dissociation stimulator 1-B n=1 Tax=Ischnura elegans TaxID=197161 RepID=UPI001ED8AA57|nr:rap1 GTPase-GDP dissociation stimulator 1-B [Ischnura elegans]